MEHLDIWRFADELRRTTGLIQYTTPVPHYDVWRDTEEAALAFKLLFENKKEYELPRGVISSGITKRLVLRKDGIYIKQSPWGTRGAITYRPADGTDTDFDLEGFKQSVVSNIRELVDRHVASIISYRLLKQYKDRDAALDRIFGTQDY